MVLRGICRLLVSLPCPVYLKVYLETHITCFQTSMSDSAIIHSFSQSDLIPGDRYSLMFSAYSPSQNADCAAQRRDLICQFYLDTVSICFPNRAVQYFIG